MSFTTRRAVEAWRSYRGLHAGRWIVRVSRARVEVDAESLYAAEISSLVTAGAPYEVAQRLATPTLLGAEVAR